MTTLAQRLLMCCGSPMAVFEHGITSWTSIVKLSDTKTLVTYKDESNSGYGTACVITVNGTTLSPETAIVFESAEIKYTSVTKLSETKVLVVYSDTGNSSYGTACVLSISGTTVTAGTPVVFESAEILNPSVTTLSGTKTIVVYRDEGNSHAGTACVLSISGTTVTAGTPLSFDGVTSHFSIAALSETEAITAYTYYENDSYGTACVLSISGTTITAGTPVVFESDPVFSISISLLSSIKAIVSYASEGDDDPYIGACVLSISGTTITAGTPNEFVTTEGYYTSITQLSETKAAVAYSDLGTNPFNSNGAVCVLSISGTTITAGTPFVFRKSFVHSIAIAYLSLTKVIITYGDYEYSDDGTAHLLYNL